MELKPPCVVTARTIDEAWFKCLSACFEEDDNGNLMWAQKYHIDRGSYAGQNRLEIDWLVLDVTHPFEEPRIPQAPDGIPLPTNIDRMVEYAPYILEEHCAEDEAYTYGRRIRHPMVVLRNMDFSDRVPRPFTVTVNGQQYNVPAVDGEESTDFAVQYDIDPVHEIIRMFQQDGFGTNQAVMEVGQPTDILLADPPCLRKLQFRIRNHGTKEEPDNVMHLYANFRSWDLWGGLPENLNGLQYLKEYVAMMVSDHTDVPDVRDGQLRVECPGAHVYDHAWEVGAQRSGRTGTLEQLLDSRE